MNGSELDMQNCNAKLHEAVRHECSESGKKILFHVALSRKVAMQGFLGYCA